MYNNIVTNVIVGILLGKRVHSRKFEVFEKLIFSGPRSVLPETYSQPRALCSHISAMATAVL